MLGYAIANPTYYCTRPIPPPEGHPPIFWGAGEIYPIVDYIVGWVEATKPNTQGDLCWVTLSLTQPTIALARSLRPKGTPPDILGGICTIIYSYC